jgi:hypothetical protein
MGDGSEKFGRRLGCHDLLFQGKIPASFQDVPMTLPQLAM